MRTGSREVALRGLDDSLHLVRSIALEFMGDKRAALASAEAGLAAASSDLQLLRQASHLCAELGEGARAVAFARRAGAPMTLCEALLAAGEIVQAEAVAAQLCATDPLDQHAIALRATAWRLLG